MKKTTQHLYWTGMIAGICLSVLYAYLFTQYSNGQHVLNQGVPHAWRFVFMLCFFAFFSGPFMVVSDVERIGACLSAMDPERARGYIDYVATPKEKLAHFLLYHPFFYYCLIFIPVLFMLVRIVLTSIEFVHYAWDEVAGSFTEELSEFKFKWWKGYR